MCHVADVSEALAASIIRRKVYRMSEFLCTYKFRKNSGGRRDSGGSGPFGPIGTVNWEYSSRKELDFKGHKVH
jgi:hypothetical protein